MHLGAKGTPVAAQVNIRDRNPELSTSEFERPIIGSNRALISLKTCEVQPHKSARSNVKFNYCHVVCARGQVLTGIGDWSPDELSIIWPHICLDKLGGCPVELETNDSLFVFWSRNFYSFIASLSEAERRHDTASDLLLKSYTEPRMCIAQNLSAVYYRWSVVARAMVHKTNQTIVLIIGTNDGGAWPRQRRCL